MYSEHDVDILLRWQASKVKFDDYEFCTSGLNSFERLKESPDIKAMKQEYHDAYSALDQLENPELQAIAKRLHPTFPVGGGSSTVEGNKILAACDAGILAARQELFDISVTLKDLYPQFSKKIH